jgi:hypothetical protein
VPEPSIKSKTGSAPIRKVGHTASNRHGSNERAQVRGSNASRDLSAK